MVFMPLPLGGGGGGKNIMAMIGMIVVMIAAIAANYFLPAVGGILLEANFSFLEAGYITAAVSAAILVGGSLLVNLREAISSILFRICDKGSYSAFAPIAPVACRNGRTLLFSWCYMPE